MGRVFGGFLASIYPDVRRSVCQVLTRPRCRSKICAMDQATRSWTSSNLANAVSMGGDRESSLLAECRQVVGGRGERDKSAIDRGAGLFGGSKKLAGAALEIEVGVGTRLPSKSEKMAVEFVSAETVRVY